MEVVRGSADCSSRGGPARLCRRKEGGTDWLDVLPYLLDNASSTLEHRPLPLTEPAWSGAPSPTPLLLLGILSGSARRRSALRCTWLRIRPPRLRVLHVVGTSGGGGGGGHGAGGAPTVDGDVLTVPVREGLAVQQQRATPAAIRDHASGSAPAGAQSSTSATGGTGTATGVGSGTISGYMKMVHFLWYAAAQPEPVVALADDDVFIQPRMLVAHARALFDALGTRPFYAGSFEYYSWRTSTLQASGWERRAKAALEKARAAWRNCTAATPDGGANDRARVHGPGRCVGPFAFAKGPLVLLSSSAVRWVVATEGFASDPSTALRLARGEWRSTPAGGPSARVESSAGGEPKPGSTARVFQDVQLGFWRHPAPHMVHSHTVHLPLGVHCGSRAPCVATMCGTGCAYTRRCTTWRCGSSPRGATRSSTSATWIGSSSLTGAAHSALH